MFKKIWLIGLIGVMAACHSNPYEGLEGKLESNPPTRKPINGQGEYVITAPALIDVVEAQNATANVTGTVQNGTPSISFSNLPSFATYAAGVLTLAPQLGDGSDPSNPSSSVREYQAQVILSSSADPVAKVSQTIVIVVHHAATSLQVTYSDVSKILPEGIAYSGSIQAASVGFPNGPFTVASTGLPTGVTITSASATSFNVSYTPAFSFVTSSNYMNYCADSTGANHLCNNLPWTLTVIDPHGDAQSVQVAWQVMDMRQTPAVVTNTSIKGTPTLAETDVYVSDPNGETVPQVTVQQPTQGTVTVTSTSTSVPGTLVPYLMAHIAWTGTPPSFSGTMQTLNINSCVYDMYQNFNNCVTTAVSVQF